MKSDLVSRQATIDLITTGAVALTIDENDDALDVMEKTVTQMKKWMVECIAELPSSEPEIIHCAECKYQDKGSNESDSWNMCGYRPWLNVPTKDEHYCGYAKRRTDE